MSAVAIAQVMLEGFDRHYGLFRYNAQQAKNRFESGHYQAIRRLASDRITFYDQRVTEACDRLSTTFGEEMLNEGVWPDVKKAYIMLLTDHRQPELAETFFNSVTTKLLAKEYFRNEYLFVRPAVSTDYLDSDPPSYRIYYPKQRGIRKTLIDMAVDLGMACPWENIDRDLRLVLKAACHDLKRPFWAEGDLQIHVLRGLFFRNKGAYVIGRIMNDGEPIGFAAPILRNAAGQLYLDTVIFDPEQISVLFSFARAYFMVDMEVPSAYVQFLRSMMPNKPKSELYTMLGLQKQGKTLFYRDFLHHLKHSTDRFCLAAGIEGLVMLVFTLPSFPYVFKIIKDKRSKDVSREFIASKYQLVKLHDRAGRMADTWEYSNVDFPADRFESSLIEKLRAFAPSMLEVVDGRVIIKHVYIERRMMPLNLYLEHATEQEVDHAVKEYGDAIRQLVAANIFPGDMLYKNFGMTRHRRVVFYDYDEIQYLTECNFRRIPPPRTPEDEMASEPWYTVGPNDVFPEEFELFLLGQPKLRKPFMRYHAELLQADYWSAQQQRIRNGILDDVFPYPEELRFRNRHELQI
ncbi:MAG: bifunctional isocitrate dehydrogenase kinase/phosphatase [Burkholderiaceae bacterium]|nr:bifunctional isocitrate dehydrogenase kinase/phosphatase [Betaproteobacteria bacterium]